MATATASRPTRAKPDPIDPRRLAEAMRVDRLTLRVFRENRAHAIRQYAGNRWSENAGERDVPFNLLSLYTSVVGRQLVAQSPRVMLSTFDKRAKPIVAAMQDWANAEFTRSGLARVLQRAVLDALFSIGIVKVALASAPESQASGWGVKAGKPGTWAVDLDDWVCDTHARDWRQCAYMGHRYRVPYEAVRNDPRFPPSLRKKLTVSTDQPYNAEGDERPNVQGRGFYGTSLEDVQPMVDLWEIYLPRQRRVLTLADDDLSGTDPEPLLEQEWVGPDTGPYHVLGYGIVPANLMPKAPIQDLIVLHEAVNGIFRKLIRQAQRQKEVGAVQGSAATDAARVVEANDGDMIRVDAPDKMKALSFGGPNQANFLLGDHLAGKFSYMAGNLDILGGLAPQAKTATQDKLLAGNATAGLAEMQDATVAFVSDVADALLWYYWHHPELVVRQPFQVPGAPGVRVDRTVAPADRLGVAWADLDKRVDPYSLQHQTPQQRAAALTQIVTQVVIPMAPVLSQQGVFLDLNKYLSKLGGYLDLPDLPDILTIMDPVQPGGGGGQGGGGMPQSTSREYVRRSLGGDSAGAKQNELETSLQSAAAAGENGAINNPS